MGDPQMLKELKEDPKMIDPRMIDPKIKLIGLTLIDPNLNLIDPKLIDPKMKLEKKEKNKFYVHIQL